MLTVLPTHRSLGDPPFLSLNPVRDLVTMAGKFEPKEPVQLNPPKEDPISLEELSQADG